MNLSDVIERFLITFVSSDKEHKMEEKYPDIVLSLLGKGAPIDDNDINGREAYNLFKIIFSFKKHRFALYFCVMTQICSAKIVILSIIKEKIEENFGFVVLYLTFFHFVGETSHQPFPCRNNLYAHAVCHCYHLLTLTEKGHFLPDITKTKSILFSSSE